MSKYLFSAKNNAFYPLAMEQEYENAGCWPADGVECDEGVFTEYSGVIPDGKIRGGDANGNPAWVDAPTPTKEQYVQIADGVKATLLSESNQTTADWRTELELGIISDDDKATLILWMNYNKLVKAVDTSTAPDIEWPEKPA